MKPESNSLNLLSVTRSKAKMYEYSIPLDYHIDIPKNPSSLFTLAIGILGELSAKINSQEDVDQEYIEETRKSLLFSANFFDSYLNSKLNENEDIYLILLSSAAYYLTNLPGSSLVLIRRIRQNINLEAGGLENFLVWLLKGDFSNQLNEIDTKHQLYISQISFWLTYYWENGAVTQNLFDVLKIFRNEIYKEGTPRELLLADVICATVKLRQKNSTWHSLPIYSGLSIDLWTDIIKKENFVRELWPSQHLLGDKNIFKGTSAVIQMPTSAGKTKAIEIIIRSTFLANRTNLVIIVAPFKALCHEIRNTLFTSFLNEKVNIDELSDVFQADFELDKFLGRRQILIVTPEKLLYVLRFDARLADYTGLIIYDEGHQFDNGSRGISYELLLTSLKLFIAPNTQTILISAVIRNAEKVNAWLNGASSELVFGTTLLPTYKSIAFASWMDQLGRLEFVNPTAPEETEYYVPRVLEEYELTAKSKERSKKYFPKKADAKSIALYLGLKLVHNGAVALFCGKKDLIPNFCKEIVDVYERKVPLSMPIEYANIDEVKKISYLYAANLGQDAPATKSAELGIFTHHGNTPNGIRLGVEYALQKSLVRFVICTSTLAQGVNLPIRYLIISDVSQGQEPISVRDFHNLIGRAGRAGMHTEGNIIFSNPKIFDKKRSYSEQWRWQQTKDLLTIEKSEPCASTLLKLLKPINFVANNTEYYYTIEQLINLYINNFADLVALPYKEDNLDTNKKSNTVLFKGINEKLDIINAIESYLMFYWNNDQIEKQDEILESLITNTLAFHLADESEKELLKQIFYLIHENIQIKVPDNLKRKVFGRTLKGVNDSLYIENWLNHNLILLLNCSNQEQLLDISFDLLHVLIKNKYFSNIDKDILINIAKLWIAGESFFKIFESLNLAKLKVSNTFCVIENVVDICVNGFAFDASLIIGSMIEVLKYIIETDISDLIDKLSHLQKRIKYGLPSEGSIILYELGFSDRVVALDLEQTYQELANNIISSRSGVIRNFKLNKDEYKNVLDKYPSYFKMILNEVSNRITY